MKRYVASFLTFRLDLYMDFIEGRNVWLRRYISTYTGWLSMRDGYINDIVARHAPVKLYIGYGSKS